MKAKNSPTYPTNYNRQNQIDWINQALPDFVPSITISGLTAVGKSSTVKAMKILLDKEGINMKFTSAGDLICEAINHNTDSSKGKDKEALLLGLSDSKVSFTNDPDDIVERRVFELGQVPFQIIDGRIPHALTPLAFHVLLDCPYEVRANRRAFNPQQNKSKKTEQAILNEIKDRDDRDLKRYQIKRPGSLWSPADFDLICSTYSLSPEQCADLIVNKFKDWCYNWKQQGRLNDTN